MSLFALVGVMLLVVILVALHCITLSGGGFPLQNRRSIILAVWLSIAVSTFLETDNPTAYFAGWLTFLVIQPTAVIYYCLQPGTARGDRIAIRESRPANRAVGCSRSPLLKRFDTPPHYRIRREVLVKRLKLTKCSRPAWR